MNIVISQVSSKKELKQFAKLPFKIYKNNKYWAPPLIKAYKQYVCGINNNLNKAGENSKFIATIDGKIVGRVLVGIDNLLNNYKNLKDGYISQFECIENYKVAKTLLDVATNYLKEKGIKRVKGPISLPGGDDNRGFIIDNFEKETTIMNTYNLPYYNDFFIKYGFEKYHDCYGFHTEINDLETERYEKIIPIAMKRYKFTLDVFDKENIKKEAADIKKILQQGIPEEWEDFMPLTSDDIDNVISQIVNYINPNLIFIARNLQGEPIGFNLTLPDYNQVLTKMKGKFLPTGIFKYFFYKNKISRLRAFVLFVIPEYYNKGVSAAIYLQTYLNALKEGYKDIEASTIWDYNDPMLNDIQKIGLEPTITYRIYIKNI